MLKKISIFLVLIVSITLVGCEDSTKKVEKKKDEPKIVEKEEQEIKEEIVEEEKEEIVEEPVKEEKKESPKKAEIKISYTRVQTMKQNHEHKLNASASGATITYSSSNTKCVTVDKKGTIKAIWISNKEKCNSTITITATKNGENKKETFNVTVKEDTTPPTIECSIYKEAKNGVYLSVKESDDESGLKKECDPYCIMPIYTKTTTHEVYDKAGNVSTCTVNVQKGCPRGYKKDKNNSDSCVYQEPVSVSITYVNSCEETGWVDCEKAVVTGEEAEKLCDSSTCDKKKEYYCVDKNKYIYDRKYCLGHSGYVYLGEIAN